MSLLASLSRTVDGGESGVTWLRLAQLSEISATAVAVVAVAALKGMAGAAHIVCDLSDFLYQRPRAFSIGFDGVIHGDHRRVSWLASHGAVVSHIRRFVRGLRGGGFLRVMFTALEVMARARDLFFQGTNNRHRIATSRTAGDILA